MVNTSKELLDAPDHPSKPTFLESLLVVNKESSSEEIRSKNADRKPKAGPSTSTVSQSQVLGKVQDFLGVMATANEKLQDELKEKSPTHFDIEALTGEEQEYIEMDLLLGVADLHTAEALSRAEATLTNFQPSKSCSSSTCTDTDDSDADDDDVDEEDDNKENRKCRLDKLDNSNEDSSCNIKPSKPPKIIPLD